MRWFAILILVWLSLTEAQFSGLSPETQVNAGNLTSNLVEIRFSLDEIHDRMKIIKNKVEYLSLVYFSICPSENFIPRRVVKDTDIVIMRYTKQGDFLSSKWFYARGILGRVLHWNRKIRVFRCFERD